MLDFISSLGIDAITAILKGLGVGLLAGLAVTLIAAKLGLFRRENKKWNMAVKLYYLYIPVIFILFFCARFAFNTGQDKVYELMDAIHADVTQTTVQGAQYAMAQVTEDGKDVSPAEIMAELGRMADNLTDRGINMLPSAVRKLVGPVRPVVSKALVSMLKKQLVKIITENSGLSNNSVTELMQIGIVASLEGGLFMDVVRHEIDRRLSPVRGNILKVFLLLLLPVVLETAFYRYRRRKLAASA